MCGYNRVTLSAKVDPRLRDCARAAARDAGLSWSEWVERAVQQAVAAEAVARVMREAESILTPVPERVRHALAKGRER
jgi:hypothetical protein